MFWSLFFIPFLLFGGVKEMIEEKVEAYRESHAITGIAVVAIGRENHQKFQLIATKGNLSLKSPIPINLFTEFRIGPLTQIVTAGALAYLVQEGQIALNDPISKFLPKSMKLPTYKGKEITLGDLATHTSSLPDMPYSLSSRSSFSVSQMDRFLSKYELPREPGTKYEYSNFGYALLANILSRIAKRSYPELASQLIMDPLGLKETVFSLSREQKKRVATGYEYGKGISPLLSEKVYSIFIGSGGLYSTPKNMLTFLSFNMGKEKTSLNAILPLMQTPYHSFKGFKMGLGWKISSLTKEGDPYYHLSGTLFGFGMYMGLIPSRDVGVMILTNQGELDPAPFGEELLKGLLSQPH
ncbi:MAG: beta-lactamase family protein [Chlamydiia bacterium]|nr:beta-lactamase family protein [Chlamydiia bacterium]